MVKSTSKIFWLSWLCLAEKRVSIFYQKNNLSMRSFIFTSVFCGALTLFSADSKAQIQAQQVTQPSEVQNLVHNLLLGSGVLASNVQSFGSWYLQLGTFTDATSSLDMASGVVMSTGFAPAVSVGFSGGSGCCGGNFGGAANEDLYNLANYVFTQMGYTGYNIGQVLDIVSIEFDFIPLGDNINVNYRFASNEYLEYVNSPFNDVFGFFVSGPGITGPYSSPAEFPGGSVNIANVPGVDPPLPITVSSISPGFNGEYYINNPNHLNINLDGYTALFTASKSGLIPGETYHIRLAIADAADAVFDSAVLLEAGSFTSEVPANGNAADYNGDGVVNFADLYFLLTDFGCQGPPACAADLSGDGNVSFADVILFMELFGIIIGG